MAQLPTFNTDNQVLSLLQDKWSSQLDPLLASPLNNARIIKNITLAIGNNVINTLLGRAQQGYFLVDQQGPAVIYRSAPFNNLTLTLNSDAVVTVSIGVF